MGGERGGGVWGMVYGLGGEWGFGFGLSEACFIFIFHPIPFCGLQAFRCED